MMFLMTGNHVYDDYHECVLFALFGIITYIVTILITGQVIH